MRNFGAGSFAGPDRMSGYAATAAMQDRPGPKTNVILDQTSMEHRLQKTIDDLILM